MRIWLSIWIALSSATAVALLVIDPRYYVMPGGTLPEGLPLLGTSPTERVFVAAVTGLLSCGIIMAGVVLARALWKRDQ